MTDQMTMRYRIAYDYPHRQQMLDAYVAECEATARAQGWEGDWTLQVMDVDTLVRFVLRRRLTAAEGEYLDIPRWADAHVDWSGEDVVEPTEAF